MDSIRAGNESPLFQSLFEFDDDDNICIRKWGSKYLFPFKTQGTFLTRRGRWVDTVLDQQGVSLDSAVSTARAGRLIRRRHR